MKLVLLILGLVATFSVGEGGIPIPQRYADAWRVMVMTLAGLTGGLLVWSFVAFARLRIDPRDKLLRPMAGLAIAYFLLTLYVCADLAARLGELVTWRTPTGFVALTVMLWAAFRMFKVMRRIAKVAQDVDAVVKVTAVDTSKPGPDVDLDGGNDVVNGR